MESRLSPRGKVVVLWLTAGLGVLLLSRVPHILSPFLWALVTAYVLQPLISAFQRVLRLPRALVAFVLYVGLMTLVVFAATSRWCGRRRSDCSASCPRRSRSPAASSSGASPT